MEGVAVRPTKYHLVSEFGLTSQRKAVWETLRAIRQWPSWWRWSKRVDVVRDASDAGVGAIYRNHIRTPLLYGFTYSGEIVNVDPPRTLELVSSGDLVGRARFDLSDGKAGGTHVLMTWLAETPKWWMNLMAPMSRPAFVWNHDHLMTDFGKGLAKASGGRLTEVRNRVLRSTDAGFFQMPG
jgi:uncharacterized protein YndB with AHSA1/START domain